MYIIGHGEVDVKTGDKHLASLKEGQYFGEVALLEETIRNADVSSKSYCDLYVFKKEDFLEVIGKYPELYDKFTSLYRRRNDDRRKAA